MQDSGSPLGFHWVAIDEDSEEVIAKSFALSVLHTKAKDLGYKFIECQPN